MNENTRPIKPGRAYVEVSNSDLRRLCRETIKTIARNTPIADSDKPGGELADAMDEARLALQRVLMMLEMQVLSYDKEHE